MQGVHTRHIEIPSAAYGKGDKATLGRRWTPLLELFGTIQQERRSVAWDLAMNALSLSVTW